VRLVVTRPEQDAAPWVQGLRARGHEVTSLPLIAIGPAPDPEPLRLAWQLLEHYQALMFVSGNAVAQFCAAQTPASLTDWSQRAPATKAWATGPGTRRALLKAGVAASQIEAPESGQFDSEALWQRVQNQVSPGHKVLIVRGADARPAVPAQGVGRDWLAQTLQDAGVPVEFVVAYQRLAPSCSPAQREWLGQAALDGSVWLFSSSEAITNLQQLAPRQSWQQARAVATHPRIAQAARAAGFGVVWESRPSLEDVLASIESTA
jgi:uroporphyrinogen-III synthase